MNIFPKADYRALIHCDEGVDQLLAGLTPRVHVRPQKSTTVRTNVMFEMVSHEISPTEGYVFYFRASDFHPDSSLSYLRPNADGIYRLAVSEKDMRILPHQMISLAHQGTLNSDRKLYTIHSLNEGTDNRTPDSIFVDSENKKLFRVTEYQGTQSDRTRSRDFGNKVAVYLDDLSRRANDANLFILYDVIIVSSGGVTCSFDFHNQMFASSLVEHYRLGLWITEYAISTFGYNPNERPYDDEFLTLIEKSVHDSSDSSKIKLNSDDPLEITWYTLCRVNHFLLMKSDFECQLARKFPPDNDSDIMRTSRINMSEFEDDFKKLENSVDAERYYRKQMSKMPTLPEREKGDFMYKLSDYSRSLETRAKKKFAAAVINKKNIVNESEKLKEDFIKKVNNQDKTKQTQKAVVQLPYLVYKGVLKYDRQSVESYDTIFQDISDEMYEIPEDPTRPDSVRMEHPLISIWKKAFSSMQWGRFQPLMDWQMEESITKISEVKEQIMSDNRQRFKVKMAMNAVEEIYAAKLGVHGKAFRGHVEKLAAHEESKKSFHWDTKTTDIQDYIFDISDIQVGAEKKVDIWDPTLSMLYQKAKLALQLGTAFGDNMAKSVMEDRAEEIFEKLSHTDLFSAEYLISLILEEVNASAGKMGDSDEYIVKKLKGIPLWLLISPTTSTKPTFFSVMAPREHFEMRSLPFKAPSATTENYFFYDFVSTNRHRTSHLLFSHLKTAGLYTMWCELQRVDPLMALDLDDASHTQMKKHFKASNMVMLDSKTQTAANVQLIRYPYNEVITSNLTGVFPFKELKKFDPRPRSRLLLWFYKRFTDVFMQMTISPPEMPEVLISRPKTDDYEGDDDENDEFDEDAKSSASMSSLSSDFGEVAYETEASKGEFVPGLLSIVDGQQLPSFETALNLSYLGSLHNKDEGEENQGFFKIFSKIVQEERKLKHARQNLLNNDSMGPYYFNLDNHEHDCIFERLLSMYQSYLFKRDHPNFDVRFKERFAYYVKRNTSDFIATLKSSAVESSTNMYFPPFIGPDGTKIEIQMNRRRRVLEGILDLIEKGMIGENPLLDIHTILTAIEARGGMWENLFKKLQLTGIREIFVMEIKTRISHLFTETVHRVLDEMLENEMLTSGEEKHSRVESHGRKFEMEMKSKKLQKQMTCCNSDDATTWAQRFVMPVFANMVCHVVPQEYFITMCRHFNMVTNKKLELPKFLLFKFTTDVHRRMFEDNDPLNIVKDQFLNPEGEHDIVDFLTIFLKNKSNMSQGLHHYTSSFTHAVYLNWTVTVNEVFFSKLVNEGSLLPSTYFLTTNLVSSDDSSAYWSVGYTLEENYKSVWTFLSICSIMKESGYGWLTILQSYEKSTSRTFTQIMEFNSTWYVSNTVMSPLIKFVYAALSPKVITRLDNRQHVMGDLRRSVLENGGTTLLASVIQIGQFFEHYHCLGAYLVSKFDEYAMLLMAMPHYSLGFFCLEPSLLCGLLSANFAFFICLKAFPESMTVHKVLHFSGVADLDELGNPTISISLLIGGLKRYNNFLERLKKHGSEGWQDHANFHPEVLYGECNSIEDCKFNIFLKSFNSNAHESFSFENAAKLHATGIFIPTHPCVQFTQHTGLTSVRTKTSLINICRTILRMCSMYSLLGDSSDMRNLEFFFPDRDNYEEAIRRLAILKTLTPQMYRFHKSRRIVIAKVYKNSKLVPISLLNCVKRKWFSKSVNGSSTSHSQSWDYYKSIFPWLSDYDGLFGYNTTLISSPFGNDPIRLAAFIKNSQPKNRTIKVIAPVRRGGGFSNLIYNVGRLSFSRVYYLTHRRGSFGDMLGPSAGKESKINSSLSTSKRITTMPSLTQIEKFKMVVSQLKTLSKSFPRINQHNFRQNTDDVSNIRKNYLAMAKIVDLLYTDSSNQKQRVMVDNIVQFCHDFGIENWIEVKRVYIDTYDRRSNLKNVYGNLQKTLLDLYRKKDKWPTKEELEKINYDIEQTHIKMDRMKNLDEKGAVIHEPYNREQNGLIFMIHKGTPLLLEYRYNLVRSITVESYESLRNIAGTFVKLLKQINLSVPDPFLEQNSAFYYSILTGRMSPGERVDTFRLRGNNTQFVGIKIRSKASFPLRTDLSSITLDVSSMYIRLVSKIIAQKPRNQKKNDDNRKTMNQDLKIILSNYEKTIGQVESLETVYTQLKYQQDYEKFSREQVSEIETAFQNLDSVYDLPSALIPATDYSDVSIKKYTCLSVTSLVSASEFEIMTNVMTLRRATDEKLAMERLNQQLAEDLYNGWMSQKPLEFPILHKAVSWLDNGIKNLSKKYDIDAENVYKKLIEEQEEIDNEIISDRLNEDWSDSTEWEEIKEEIMLEEISKEEGSYVDDDSEGSNKLKAYKAMSPSSSFSERWADIVEDEESGKLTNNERRTLAENTVMEKKEKQFGRPMTEHERMIELENFRKQWVAELSGGSNVASSSSSKSEGKQEEIEESRKIGDKKEKGKEKADDPDYYENNNNNNVRDTSSLVPKGKYIHPNKRSQEEKREFEVRSKWGDKTIKEKRARLKTLRSALKVLRSLHKLKINFSRSLLLRYSTTHPPVDMKSKFEPILVMSEDFKSFSYPEWEKQFLEREDVKITELDKQLFRKEGGEEAELSSDFLKEMTNMMNDSQSLLNKMSERSFVNEHEMLNEMQRFEKVIPFWDNVINRETEVSREMFDKIMYGKFKVNFSHPDMDPFKWLMDNHLKPEEAVEALEVEEEQEFDFGIEEEEIAE